MKIGPRCNIQWEAGTGKVLETEKSLFYAVFDLEKAYGRVPREVTRWALRKLGGATIMALYEEEYPAVRMVCEDSDGFEVI